MGPSEAAGQRESQWLMSNFTRKPTPNIWRPGNGTIPEVYKQRLDLSWNWSVSSPWIADHPDSFPKYDEEHRFALLRRYPYCMIYEEQPQRIYVIAVAHTSRSAGYWQRRT